MQIRHYYRRASRYHNKLRHFTLRRYRPDLTFTTDANGTLDPYIVTSDSSAATWLVSGEASQYTNEPSWELDGTTRAVKVWFDDPSKVTQIRFREPGHRWRH
jgi:hypothetical protein